MGSGYFKQMEIKRRPSSTILCYCFIIFTWVVILFTNFSNPNTPTVVSDIFVGAVSDTQWVSGEHEPFFLLMTEHEVKLWGLIIMSENQNSLPPFDFLQVLWCLIHWEDQELPCERKCRTRELVRVTPASVHWIPTLDYPHSSVMFTYTYAKWKHRRENRKMGGRERGREGERM